MLRLIHLTNGRVAHSTLEEVDLVSIHLTDGLGHTLDFGGGRFGFAFDKRLEWVCEYHGEPLILGCLLLAVLFPDCSVNTKDACRDHQRWPGLLG